MFFATGRYRIERGTTTNDYGDDVDTPTAIASNLLAAVAEDSRVVYQPDQDRLTRISTVTGIFKPGTDVLEGDRVVDEVTGVSFTVTSVDWGTASIMKSDVTCGMTRNAQDGAVE